MKKDIQEYKKIRLVVSYDLKQLRLKALETGRRPTMILKEEVLKLIEEYKFENDCLIEGDSQIVINFTKDFDGLTRLIDNDIMDYTGLQRLDSIPHLDSFA